MNKLIALVLIQNCVVGQIQVPPKDGLDLFNNMMRDLFNNCRTEFGTIGFWGDDRIFLPNDEADIVLLNNYDKVLRVSQTRRIKFLVVIHEKLDPTPEIWLYDLDPTIKIETMFVFDKSGFNRESVIRLFDWFQKRFENSKVYYCTATEERIDIITLNAFADVAPAFWVKIEENHFDDDDNRWTFFNVQYNVKTKFNYSPVLCENIFFDRTKKLNGYKIKVSAKLHDHFELKFLRLNQLITKDNETSRVNSILKETEGPLAKCLTDYLDVSLNVTHGMPSYFGLNIAMILLNRTLDLGLTPTNWVPDEWLSDLYSYFYPSYPLRFFYVVIVTHNRGLSSPLEKMFEFYGWLIIIATFIILLITFIVIYLSSSEKNSRLSFTVFECLRLLINNSIYTRMDTDRMRMFFFVIFLYFLIIQATFSGNLAAFLTKPVYRKNIETLEDLKDPRYTAIYSYWAGLPIITDPILLNKTKFGDSECEKYINDKSVACIDNKFDLDFLIINYNLHVPKSSLRFGYASPVMRHNWFLSHRINYLFMRLEQSGISKLWMKNLEEPIANEYRKIQNSAENYHRPIEFGDVTFAFLLLIIGLLTAFFCFTIEYLTNNFTSI